MVGTVWVCFNICIESSGKFFPDKVTCEQIWMSDKENDANKRRNDIVGSKKIQCGGHEGGGSEFGMFEKEQGCQCG